MRFLLKSQKIGKPNNTKIFRGNKTKEI